jgi:hypothetical protein
MSLLQAKVDVMNAVLGPGSVAPLLNRLPVILTLSTARFMEVSQPAGVPAQPLNSYNIKCQRRHANSSRTLQIPYKRPHSTAILYQEVLET